MQNFHLRLAKAIHDSGKTKKALADYSDVVPSTVTRWLTASTLPEAGTLERVAEFLCVNAKWLLTGMGPIKPDEMMETAPAAVREAAAAFNGAPPETMVESVARIAVALERIAAAMESGRRPE